MTSLFYYDICRDRIRRGKTHRTTRYELTCELIVYSANPLTSVGYITKPAVAENACLGVRTSVVLRAFEYTTERGIADE